MRPVSGRSLLRRRDGTPDPLGMGHLGLVRNPDTPESGRLRPWVRQAAIWVRWAAPRVRQATLQPAEPSAVGSVGSRLGSVTLLQPVEGCKPGSDPCRQPAGGSRQASGGWDEGSVHWPVTSEPTELPMKGRKRGSAGSAQPFMSKNQTSEGSAAIRDGI